jgi:hypothetical protein
MPSVQGRLGTPLRCLGRQAPEGFHEKVELIQGLAKCSSDFYEPGAEQLGGIEEEVELRPPPRGEALVPPAAEEFNFHVSEAGAVYKLPQCRKAEC